MTFEDFEEADFCRFEEEWFEEEWLWFEEATNILRFEEELFEEE